jgi:beta-N-acetylhexosaminidase
MVEGFVRALAAGADAIETGAQDYPELVELIPAAVARAVAEGRLPMARLRDAADRTAALATTPLPQSGGRNSGPVFDHPTGEGDICARCLEVLGALPALHAPLVIECRTPGGMASGELPWSVGAPLAELAPGVEIVHAVTELPLPADRDVVLVVRDPQRIEWQQPMLAAAAGRPGTVVVDCGWPADIAGVPVVRTRGVAPGLLHAAAELLAGGGR